MTPGHTDVTKRKKIVGIDYGKIVHNFKVHFQVKFQSSTLEDSKFNKNRRSL